MRDGSMFAGLHKYEKESFSEDHDDAYVYTSAGWDRYEFVSQDTVEPSDAPGEAGAMELCLITCSHGDRRLVTRWTKAS